MAGYLPWKWSINSERRGESLKCGENTRRGLTEELEEVLIRGGERWYCGTRSQAAIYTNDWGDESAESGTGITN